MRFGLCCIFIEEPVKFRVTTARVLSRLPRREQLGKLSEICLHNVRSLLTALQTVDRLGIGAFRIQSGLFPRMTHPEVGYLLDELPERDEIISLLAAIKAFREARDIRMSFHPDQFNMLSSPRAEVVANTVRELEYQAEVSEMVGADVITIHGGGSYGRKDEALERFRRNLPLLSERARSRLALENDDRVYTVADLLPLCRETGIPLVYDVHHHRCLPDRLSVEEATAATCATWETVGKDPYLHISSPRGGWESRNPRDHADYIDIGDYPRSWLNLRATLDVEAKAKELAVVKLMREVAGLATENR